MEVTTTTTAVVGRGPGSKEWYATALRAWDAKEASGGDPTERGTQGTSWPLLARVAACAGCRARPSGAVQSARFLPQAAPAARQCPVPCAGAQRSAMSEMPWCPAESAVLGEDNFSGQAVNFGPRDINSSEAFLLRVRKREEMLEGPPFCAPSGQGVGNLAPCLLLSCQRLRGRSTASKRVALALSAGVRLPRAGVWTCIEGSRRGAAAPGGTR